MINLDSESYEAASGLNNPLDDSPPPLFKAPKTRKKESWQFVRLVAPSKEKRMWKADDAVGAWCTKCNVSIKYKGGNTRHVHAHMSVYHTAEFNAFRALQDKKSQQQSDIRSFGVAKAMKDLPRATKEEQLFCEALLVKWICESLRPFSVVQDKGLSSTLHTLRHCTASTSLQDVRQFERVCCGYQR